MDGDFIENWLRQKYVVRRSPRSDVLGFELHYVEAEVRDLAGEILKLVNWAMERKP